MNNINDYTVVGLKKVNSIDFIDQIFKLYNEGSIVALLDDNVSDSELSLSQVIIPESKFGWYSKLHDVRTDNSPAQIVYSSGTEGKAKAILISHQSLSDVVSRLNSIMGLDSSVKEYVGVPVTYSFGLGRCRAVCAAGGSFFIPEKGFDPTEIRQMLDNDEINAISAVPTLWRMILLNPDVIGEAGLKVRWIEIGSQYMSRAEKEQMKQLFPNAKIIQHYGLTEASRSTFLDISTVSGELLESVGKAYGDIEVSISDDNRIKIRGPNVALGVIQNNEITPLVDDDSWLLTNDNGHFTDNYLFYDGRSDDIINFGGIKVNPDLLQIKLEKSLNVENEIAICRIKDELRGDGIYLAILKDSKLSLEDIKKKANDILLEMGVNAHSSLIVERLESLPRTATGKLQRKKLSEQYANRNKIRSKQSNKQDAKTVLDIYKKVFPKHEVSNDSNFKNLGGDSLNYVQLTMMLEKYLGHIPANWEVIPISDLEKSKATKKHRFAHIEIASFLRAIAILFIVGTHSGVEIMGGGTLLLIFLVGYNFSRFKSVDIINGHIWKSLWSYIKLVLIPYYLLAAVYLYWNKSFEPDVLLLYANLLEAKITVIFPFWFVQILVQCLLLTGVIFSLSYMREKLAINPWKLSLNLLIVFILIRFLYPFVWDTSLLNDLVPLRFMAIIWLGWCFYYADTTFRRSLLVVLSTLFAFIDTGLKPETAWLIAGSLCMAYVPYIKAPHLIKHIVQVLASATFYIFVFNGVFIYFVIHVLNIDSSFLAFGAGLFSSIFIWWAIEYLYMNDRLKFLTLFKYRKKLKT